MAASKSTPRHKMDVLVSGRVDGWMLYVRTHCSCSPLHTDEEDSACHRHYFGHHKGNMLLDAPTHTLGCTVTNTNARAQTIEYILEREPSVVVSKTLLRFLFVFLLDKYLLDVLSVLCDVSRWKWLVMTAILIKRFVCTASVKFLDVDLVLSIPFEVICTQTIYISLRCEWDLTSGIVTSEHVE